MSAQPRFVQCK